MPRCRVMNAPHDYCTLHPLTRAPQIFVDGNFAAQAFRADYKYSLCKPQVYECCHAEEIKTTGQRLEIPRDIYPKQETLSFPRMGFLVVLYLTTVHACAPSPSKSVVKCVSLSSDLSNNRLQNRRSSTSLFQLRQSAL